MAVGEFITVEVEGLAELEANLNLLAENVAKQVLKKAATAAMVPLQNRIIANAPVGTETLPRAFRRGGTLRTIRLREGILMNVTIKSDGVRGATVRVRIGLRKDIKFEGRSIVFYGKFIEFGTVHMPAKRFFRNAFDVEKEYVIQRLADELEQGIEAVAVKARSRA